MGPTTVDICSRCGGVFVEERQLGWAAEAAQQEAPGPTSRARSQFVWWFFNILGRAVKPSAKEPPVDKKFDDP